MLRAWLGAKTLCLFLPPGLTAYDGIQRLSIVNQEIIITISEVESGFFRALVVILPKGHFVSPLFNQTSCYSKGQAIS